MAMRLFLRCASLPGSGGAGCGGMPAPMDLEQELEDLDVAFGLGQVLAPGVQPMAAQQESVRLGVHSKRLFDLFGKERPVLQVLEYGQAFAVLVGAHAVQTFE